MLGNVFYQVLKKGKKVEELAAANGYAHIMNYRWSFYGMFEHIVYMILDIAWYFI